MSKHMSSVYGCLPNLRYSSSSCRSSLLLTYLSGGGFGGFSTLTGTLTPPLFRPTFRSSIHSSSQREDNNHGGDDDESDQSHNVVTAVMTWGKCRNSGVLGGGATVDEPFPVEVFSLRDTLSKKSETNRNGTIALMSGLHHMALLDGDGNVHTWGKGAGGRLGHGDELEGFVPDAVVMPEGVTHVTQASLGGLHTAAIVRHESPDTPDALLTFGHGGFGQLGLGDTTPRFEPTQVTGLPTPPARVSCGGAHTVVALTDGRLVAFGRDEGDGRLGSPEVSTNSAGDDFAIGSAVPVEVTGFSSKANNAVDGIASLSCGGFHTLCADGSGAVWSWGGSANGECGRGRGIGGPVPARVEGIDEAVVEVAAGGFHSAALTADGRVYVWGWGEQGQLGLDAEQLGGLRGTWHPQLVRDLEGERVVHVACGPLQTFLITESGRLLSAGFNEHYQLGNPSRPSSARTFDEVLLPTGSKCLAVAPGSAHAGAIVRIME